jgi:hypothetical protein
MSTQALHLMVIEIDALSFRTALILYFIILARPGTFPTSEHATRTKSKGNRVNLPAIGGRFTFGA